MTAASAWGIALTEIDLARIEIYLKAVQNKNATTNLTADDAWEDLVLKHAADGLFAASVLRHLSGLSPAPRVLDLGSGGGFIGIVLKIVWPSAEVTLMEAVERKFQFLNSTCAALGLQGLRPLRRRAGQDPPRSSYETNFDIVVERALAPLPEAIALAFPLLNAGGHFAAFQTAAPDPSRPEYTRALAAAGGRVLNCISYRRPDEDRDRHLLLFKRGELNG